MQTDVKRSSRDLEAVRAGLRLSVAEHFPEGRDHEVGELHGTSATGMSSETLLFDASWTAGSERRSESLVARVAPAETDAPVFATYDLPGQFKTIQTVAALTDVPVPPPKWCEPDPSVIGSPFFVMGRVDGQVPPDVMPYNFGESWLFNAAEEDQRKLQEATVSVLARLHAIDQPERHFAHLVGRFPGSTPLRQHVADRQNWYEFAARDCGRSALVEKGFAWLEERWPRHESEAVFCWGDSRIGNVMYRDFEPVAVLDWEMAGVAPPETDVAWLAYLHQMFEDMAARYGFPGMPHFLRRDDVAATYERLSGRTPRDLDWYTTYVAVQFGIVCLRTGFRQVVFGERPAPDDADELVTNASTIANLIGA
jgi:aminoglycoside phosphotransferase (APT) family kinase protein